MAVKPLMDNSIPEAVFTTPPNIHAIVLDIEDRARRTYPDHTDSRDKFIRQEILLMLSAYANTVVDLGEIVRRQGARIAEFESVKPSQHPRGWWKLW